MGKSQARWRALLVLQADTTACHCPWQCRCNLLLAHSLPRPHTPAGCPFTSSMHPPSLLPPPLAPRRARDPWQTFQPEAVQVPTRTALRRVYNTTSRYLMRGGSLEYRVDGLHLWNVASWDALGIHWRSISAEGSYYEQGVAAIVAAHNKNLIRRAVMPRWAGGQ